MMVSVEIHGKEVRRKGAVITDYKPRQRFRCEKCRHEWWLTEEQEKRCYLCGGALR